jgi:cytoskeletal protein CcmA (bactofilin family)
MRKGGENYIAKNASEPGRSNPDKDSNAAPLPPKRSYKNRMSHGEISPQTSVVEEEVMTPGIVAGSGFNVPRRLGSQSAGKAENNRKSYEKKVYEGKKEVYFPPTRSELREYLLNQAPDVVIGDGVEIKGNFQFDGLLRLDGRFQGQFVTQEAGDVVVGPTGVLISDLTGCINRLLIEGGHVTGKIHVANVVISGNAVVKGEIVCKSLEVLDAAEATITGTTMVNFGAFDEVLSQEEEDRLQKEQEPVKIINYNKSRSAKTVFEKVSPQELEEIRSNTKKANNNLDEEAKQLAADLYEEKLEEKRKRREAKKKNDEEEEKEIPATLTTEVAPSEVVPKKKEQQMTKSDPALKEQPKAKESTAASAKPAKEVKQPEQQKSSISPKNSTVPTEEKQAEQKNSTPSPMNRAVERREPEESVQQEQKKPELDKPLTKANEVVLVSGALGSIPTIAIKARDNLGEEETEEQPRIITAREQETEPLNQSNNDHSDSPTKRIVDSIHSSRQPSPRKEQGGSSSEQQEEEEKKQDDSLPISSEGGAEEEGNEQQQGEPQEQEQQQEGEQEQPPNDENEMNKYGLSPPTGEEPSSSSAAENDNETNVTTNNNENSNNSEEQEGIPPSE